MREASESAVALQQKQGPAHGVSEQNKSHETGAIRGVSPVRLGLDQCGLHLQKLLSGMRKGAFPGEATALPKCHTSP